MSRQNEENRKKHSKKIQHKRVKEQNAAQLRKEKLKEILKKFQSE